MYMHETGTLHRGPAINPLVHRKIVAAPTLKPELSDHKGRKIEARLQVHPVRHAIICATSWKEH